jgi:hypothetical protein
MRAIAVLIPGLALWLAAGSAASQFAHPVPQQRATDEHLALLMSRAYDKLDQAADLARAKDLATSDGQPLLAAIYAGVAGCNCGNLLTDELWQVRKQRLDEWLKRKPGSPTARLARASYPVKYAWMARGGGFSNTVSNEGWRLFRERTEEGRKALEALDAKTRDDPGWYDVMLDVGLAQGWPAEKFDGLFREGVARFPYYVPLYFTRANFHAPRWYGSMEALKRVADDAAERTRPRWGEMLYARVNWLFWDVQMFRNGQASWPRMKAGFERMVQEYPDAWNLNNFGKFACIAGDLRLLAELLPKIGEKPVIEAWEGEIQNYQRCRAAALKIAEKK